MKTNQTTSFVVSAVLIQALSLPVKAEEVHGKIDGDSSPNLSLRSNYYQGFPIGGAANTAIGSNALGTENSGNGNTAVGKQPLSENTIGSHNTAVGSAALRNNTTGYENTAVGTTALKHNTIGEMNTATGSAALLLNTTGSNNVAYGRYALRANTTGFRNVAIGDTPLMLNTSGHHNVAVGFNASKSSTTGINNVAVGYHALASNKSGHFNTAIGPYAGFFNTGSNNVFIGHGAGASSSETAYAMKSNQLAIANSVDPDSEIITGDFSEKTIGLNGSVTVKNHLDVKGELRAFQSLRVNKNIYTNGHLKVKKTATAQSFNTTSDARLKDDIQPLNDALSSVLQLQGKTYRWKEDHHKQDIGLIAQEVEQVFPELVTEDANGFKAIAYSRLTAVLIEAIKEQQGQMTTQQDQMIAQQQQMTEQETRFTAQITALEKENTQLKTIMAEQMDALLARVAMLEGESLAAN